MGRKRATLRIGALIVAWMLPLMFVAAKSLTASLYTPKTTTRVKIGDIDSGALHACSQEGIGCPSNPGDHPKN
jgi:hypothetical protein